MVTGQTCPGGCRRLDCTGNPPRQQMGPGTMIEAPDPQTPAVTTERIGPAQIHTMLGHSMGARVFEGTTTSGEAATVWSWPSDQVGGAAIPRLLAIIEGSSEPGAVVR